jgi:hypothetical protein
LGGPQCPQWGQGGLLSFLIGCVCTPPCSAVRDSVRERVLEVGREGTGHSTRDSTPIPIIMRPETCITLNYLFIL